MRSLPPKKRVLWLAGLVFTLVMIGLAEYAEPPNEGADTEAPVSSVATSDQPAPPEPPKNFRSVLQAVKTIPAHLQDAKTQRQVIYAKRVAGTAEPHAGPMALLSQMKEVKIEYLNQFDVTTIEIPPDWDAGWLMEILNEDTSVEYTEKADYEITLHRAPVTPNDPFFPQQTNLHDPVRDVDVNAPQAWAYTTGNASSDGIVVAVMDTEFAIHSDFEGNLWVNDQEIAGNGIDDDHNGLVDDIHGYDFSRSTGNLTAGTAGHGATVAGVLGARGNNRHQIAGVSWKVRMMFLDFIRDRGSFIPGIGEPLTAFNYILNMRDRHDDDTLPGGADIRMINASWTRTPPSDCIPKTLSKAYKRLEARGILFVQGAGNDGTDIDGTDTWPRCLEGLSNHIHVASHDRTSFSLASRSRASRSNYGLETVDLAAPGEEVLAAVRADGSIGRNSGTSLATPHVSGATALLWNYRPDLTMVAVRNILLETVRRVPELAGRVATGGALDVGNALYMASLTPGIVLHTSRTAVIEGGRGYADVSLRLPPSWRTTSGVAVLRAGVAQGLGEVSPSSLTFTWSNWREAQRFSFDARDELDVGSGYTADMRIAVDALRTTTDSRGISPTTVTFTVADVGVSSATVSSLSGDEVSESDGKIAFRIRLRGVAGTASTPVDVGYRLSGATRGGVAGDTGRDYTWPVGYDAEAGIGTATVVAGDTAVVALPLHDDEVNEADEDVSLALLRVVAGGVEGVLSSGSRATVLINDDDPLTVSIENITSTGTFGGRVVSYVPVWCGERPRRDPFSLLTPDVPEGCSIRYRIRMSGVSSGAVVVPWRAQRWSYQGIDDQRNDASRPDVATEGGMPQADGGVMGSAYIEAGETSATIEVVALRDNFDESESGDIFEMRLGESEPSTRAGRVTSRNHRRAHFSSGRLMDLFGFSIDDPDGNLIHRISARAAVSPVAEGSSAVFTVELEHHSLHTSDPPAAGHPLVVDWVLGGVESSDYAGASSGSLSFATRGVQSVVVRLVEDGVIEADEELVLTLYNERSSNLRSGIRVITPSVRATIRSRERATVRLESLATRMFEGSTGTAFRIWLESSGGVPITVEQGAVVSWTLAGSAVEGLDYRLSPSGRAEIPAGGSETVVRLWALADAVRESSESVVMRLAGVDARGAVDASDNKALVLSDDEARTVIAANRVLRVKVRALLQGAYDPARTMMRTALIEHLPAMQPYNVRPWHHAATTTVPGITNGSGLSSVTATVVDWVLVELRTAPPDVSTGASTSASTGSSAQAAANAPAFAREAALLLRDGTIAGIRPGASSPSEALEPGGVSFAGVDVATASSGTWYIVLHHRNHLSVMSAARLESQDTACPADYCADFRTAQSHGDGQVAVGEGLYALPAGDTNRDGTIDAQDHALIRTTNLIPLTPAHYRTPNESGNYKADADLNHDAEVLSQDRHFIIKNHGRRRMISVR